MTTDAERVLAEDPEGFAHLRAVLHGPAGPAAGRRIPTIEDRFGVPALPGSEIPRPPAPSAGHRRVACPSRGRS